MHAARPSTVAEGLHAALDELSRVDVSGLTDRQVLEAVRELHEAEARAAAERARLIAEMDARSAHQLDGAQSAAQWIAHTCRIPSGVARGEVTMARTLRHLPEVARALADGDTTVDMVTRIVRLHRNPRARAAAERDDDLLADAARNLGWVDFLQALAYWLLANDPDGSDEQAEERRARRRLHLTPTFDGSWNIGGLLDPIGGSIVDAALRRIGDELYAHDRAEAAERLGRDPLQHELGRTPQQRRADALVEMAKRATSAPPGARRPAPLVSIVVDDDTFAKQVCELINGTVLHPRDIAALLDEAIIERIIFDGPSRVMNIGHQRLFTGALRRAIELRDRTCTHPLCDAPVWRCHVDHRRSWIRGGKTTQDNGRLYCPFHNHLRQRRRPPDDVA